MDAAVSAAKGRCKLIAHVGANCTDDSVALAKHAAKILAYPISYRDCPFAWKPGLQTGPLDKGRTLVFRIGKPPSSGRCEVRLETKPRLASEALAKVTLNGIAPERGGTVRQGGRGQPASAGCDA